MGKYRVDAYWIGFGHVTTGNFEYDGDGAGLEAFAGQKAAEMLPWERCPNASLESNLKGNIHDESGLFVAFVEFEPPMT